MSRVKEKSIWFEVDNIEKLINKNIKNTYHWKNPNNLPIKLTVGLPLFKSDKIVWLALESLKNQVNINFGWELIIYEEFGDSLETIKSFVGKLPNCQRIFYKQVGHLEKIPLSSKWITIGKQASKTSKVFVFHDADDYSPTKRLYIHNEHFKNSNCFLSSQIEGIFYNIKSGKTILYNGRNIDRELGSSNHTNLNHAILTKDIKNMVDPKQYRLMHSFIFKNIKRIHAKNIHKKYIWTSNSVSKNNWKTGVFTDGFNTISRSRKRFYNKPVYQFEVCRYKLKKYIPLNVIRFLYSLKNV